ncbi:hypothetical protein JL721_10041 [Aureococcus anophagefferens]|nr:hypothetical protein JL721_10041 [Aureococcus anophagefferens]
MGSPALSSRQGTSEMLNGPGVPRSDTAEWRNVAASVAPVEAAASSATAPAPARKKKAKRDAGGDFEDESDDESQAEGFDEFDDEEASDDDDAPGGKRKRKGKPTAEAKAEMTKQRNRESTRSRSGVKTAVFQAFLLCRVNGTVDRDRWRDIVDDHIRVTLPQTPYRATNTHAAPEDVVIVGDRLMCHWKATTRGLADMGFDAEVSLDGLGRATFHKNKLRDVELSFDALSFTRQLQAFGLLDLGLIRAEDVAGDLPPAAQSSRPAAPVAAADATLPRAARWRALGAAPGACRRA